MTVLLAVPFVAGVLFVLFARMMGTTRNPDVIARWLTVGSVSIALSTSGALALLAWPLLARVPAIAAAGGWRAGAVGDGVPIAEPVSVLAFVLLAIVAVRLLRTAAQLGREVRRLGTAQRALAASETDPVVILDDPMPLAYAAPGLTVAGGRTVISIGLLDALDPAEREAVLAHEQAHLDHRHHLFTVLLELAVALNPTLATTAAHARFELERWADEDAAGATSRTVTASALAKTALTQLEYRRGASATPSFRLEIGRHRTSDRVAAMLDPSPSIDRARLLKLRLMVAPAGAALVALVWAMHDMEGVFEAVRRFR